MNGKIIKGVGGFYYVHLHHDLIYECKAKGIFRNQKIKPVVGDNVSIDIIDEDKKIGNIVDILPRDNVLIRPAVANVDQALVIFALSDPKPNFNLLDRFLISMDKQNIKTTICFNKSDLVDAEYAKTIKQVYSNCGYDVIITSTFFMDNEIDDQIKELKALITGRTTVLAGPSGVGKSSIVNLLCPMSKQKTGEISQKIKRGKHTTRHTELLFVEDNTYVLDTPGFTSLYVDGIECSDLRFYYNEFEAYEGSCKYNGCVHINEPECAVKKALEESKISQIRYDNYLVLYNELKESRKW